MADGEWPRLRVGVLAGMAAFALVPNLPWFVGVVWVWPLIMDERPAYRVICSVWLVLTAMTPFYHPYARLWLPLEAVGWILLAGAVVKLGPFADSAFAGGVSLNVRKSRAGLIGLASVLCVVATHILWIERTPQPFPIRSFFAPTDGLRSALAGVAKSPPLARSPGMTLWLLARRPVAFYLALHGISYRLLESDRNLIPDSRGSGHWTMIDEGVFDFRDHADELAEMSKGAIFAGGSLLDPVTRLDISPGDAYGLFPPHLYRLVLFRSAPPAVSRVQETLAPTFAPGRPTDKLR